MREAPGAPLLATLVAAAVILMAGACGSSAPECGWDLSTHAGRDAIQHQLDVVLQWQASHPGQPAPRPDSPYWRGECPTPSGGASHPPDHEDEGLGEHADGTAE